MQLVKSLFAELGISFEIMCRSVERFITNLEQSEERKKVSAMIYNIYGMKYISIKFKIGILEKCSVFRMPIFLYAQAFHEISLHVHRHTQFMPHLAQLVNLNESQIDIHIHHTSDI